MNYNFNKISWEQYLYWQKNDKKILNGINTLLKDISRNPYDGLGKPEMLKNYNGY